MTAKLSKGLGSLNEGLSSLNADTLHQENGTGENAPVLLEAPAPFEDTLGRPPIYLTNYDDKTGAITEQPIHVVSEAVIDIFRETTRLNVYTRGGYLAQLRREDDTLYKLRVLDKDSVQGVISRAGATVKHVYQGRGENRQVVYNPLAVPPRTLGADLLYNTTYEGVKTLEGIVTHPFVWEGELVTASGYHAPSGFYYPETAACPLITPDSTEDALKVWDEVMTAFPFVGDADKENALALALTPIVNATLMDLPPLFSITAAREGAGKSFLSKCLLAPLVGKEPAVTTLKQGQEEMQKTLFSMQMEAHSVAIFDNVNPKVPLDSGQLASFVTERYSEGRLLYKNEIKAVENRLVSVYTGSNVEVSAELADRIVQIKLEAPKKRVADRDFLFNPLKERLLPERGKYLGALCYLVKKWLDTGAKLDKMARHRQRDWAQTLGGILRANGRGAHFLTNDADMRKEANPEHVQFGHFLTAIVANLGEEKATADSGFAVSDVFLIASYKKSYYEDGEHIPEEGDNMLGEYLVVKSGSDDFQRKTALGKYLRQHRDKPFAGWKLEDAGMRHKVRRWRLVKVDADAVTPQHQTRILDEDDDGVRF